MGRNITLTKDILKYHTKRNNTNVNHKTEEISNKGYYVMEFLWGKECARYGNILEDMDNEYIKGNDY